MDHYEMVEKLRQKANVSYEEAKAALEASEWDVLDALVLLEGEGKVKQEQPNFSTEEKPEPPKAKSRDFDRFFKRLQEVSKKLTDFLCHNHFYVSWKGGEAMEFPLLILFILLCVIFPVTLILLIVGFFCGARYSFKGPDVAKVKSIIDNNNQPASENENEQK